jgi:hypothetical protein
MALGPLHHHLPGLLALDAGDDADGRAALLQHRPLLDMGFEVEADRRAKRAARRLSAASSTASAKAPSNFPPVACVSIWLPINSGGSRPSSAGRERKRFPAGLVEASIPTVSAQPITRCPASVSPAEGAVGHIPYSGFVSAVTPVDGDCFRIAAVEMLAEAGARTIYGVPAKRPAEFGRFLDTDFQRREVVARGGNTRVVEWPAEAAFLAASHS